MIFPAGLSVPFTWFCPRAAFRLVFPYILLLEGRLIQTIVFHKCPRLLIRRPSNDSGALKHPASHPGLGVIDISLFRNTHYLSGKTSPSRAPEGMAMSQRFIIASPLVIAIEHRITIVSKGIIQ
ncbi:hypothetical protein LX36DRAFT_339770 [Colletotrichum falcatum]|nr:hypothetical protein LX36DRAFT_339770 [Colletotrichum falcatum]